MASGVNPSLSNATRLYNNWGRDQNGDCQTTANIWQNQSRRLSGLRFDSPAFWLPESPLFKKPQACRSVRSFACASTNTSPKSRSSEHHDDSISGCGIPSSLPTDDPQAGGSPEAPGCEVEQTSLAFQPGNNRSEGKVKDPFVFVSILSLISFVLISSFELAAWLCTNRSIRKTINSHSANELAGCDWHKNRNQ